MSDVKECDVCGDTYKLRGFLSKQAKIDVPFRYKIWEALPRNKQKVGFVEQDLCRDCKDNLEKALRLLKERENDE